MFNVNVDAHSPPFYQNYLFIGFVMKIGILLCGDVPTSLVKEFGDYSSCLQKQLNLNRYGDVTVWNVYEKFELPEHTDICDVYIIGGSPASVNDDSDWVNFLGEFIYNAFNKGRKLFGICFGHQIIHHALGGIVARSPNGWGVGPYSVTFFQDIGNIKRRKKMSLLAIHRDQVVKIAPFFDVVAGNYFCPNYMTRFKKQVLTIQGHPEFSFAFFSALINQKKDTLLLPTSNAPFKEDISTKDSLYFNAFFNKFMFE